MGQEESARLLARLTLILASFMLLVLFSVPVLMDTSGFNDFLPYALYSLLLASIGVLIGTSLTWLNLSRAGATDMQSVNDSSSPLRPVDSHAANSTGTGQAAQPTSSPLSRLSTDEALVVEYLRSRGGESWQAELVRDLDLSASKASRLLARLEGSELVHRIRDGMGKRVVLNGGEVGD